ncbi:hypothetical protein Tco_0549050 [Tanacetum coccineum]
MDIFFTLGYVEEVDNVRILRSCNGLLLCSGSVWPGFDYKCCIENGLDPRKSLDYKVVLAGCISSDIDIHMGLGLEKSANMLPVVCKNCRLTPQLHESAGGLPSLKLSLHSCSLPGSTNAMGIETSIALVLPAREHECDTSFVLGRPPALS